jgi:hypothetical protein
MPNSKITSALFSARCCDGGSTPTPSECARNVFCMTRILLGDRELEVVEDFENVLQRIAYAETNGPQIGGLRVLPAGWMIVRAVEFDEDVFVQTSTVSYVRKG